MLRNQEFESPPSNRGFGAEIVILSVNSIKLKYTKY